MDYVHLSTGDILRNEMKDETSPFKAIIQGLIFSGNLIPSEITTQLLFKAMQNSASKNFLVDGFPRSDANMNDYDTMIAPHANLKFVLNFFCPTEILLERILGRNRGPDDNESTFKVRMDGFYSTTQPVIDHYRLSGKVIDINTNNDTEQVYQEVLSHFT
jgi:UMP-CMP kinase